GRNENTRSHDRRREPEPRPVAEAGDRDVRKPGAPLAAVDAERLEPLLDVVCECRRAPADVGEHHHRHGPRLAVAVDSEPVVALRRRGGAERVDDRGQLGRRAVAEEGERDVQVVARHDAEAGRERAGLPAREIVEHVVRELQREKEPETLIAPDASGRGHTESSELRVRSVRTRWSAMTTERARIDARSPGKSNSRAREPSGPSAWR